MLIRARAPIRRPPSGVSSIADSGNPPEVDDQGRPGDAVLHPVDKLGAAGDEGRRRVAGDGGDGRPEVVGTGVGEGVHGRSSCGSGFG
jgi:hypothetical protein